MAKRYHAKRTSLARTYAVRGSLLKPNPESGSTSYFSTALLKGGKSAYKGNVVTRDAKSGRIVSIKKAEKVES